MLFRLTGLCNYYSTAHLLLLNADSDIYRAGGANVYILQYKMHTTGEFKPMQIVLKIHF